MNSHIRLIIADYGSIDESELGEDKFAGSFDLDEATQALEDYFLGLVDNTSSLGASHPQFANYISSNELRQAIKEGK